MPEEVKVPDSAQLAWRRERFRDLYQKYHRDLWHYCLRRAINPDEAEEIFGDTFLLVWQRLEDVPSGSDARPWLYGVARNHLRNGWRKNKRNRALKERIARSVNTDPPSDPSELAPSGTQHIIEALDKLRDRDREILQLVAWEELNHHELALVLGCSENMVSVRLHRARNRFEKQLKNTTNTNEMQDLSDLEHVRGQGVHHPQGKESQ